MKLQEVLQIDEITATPKDPYEVNGCPFCHQHRVEIWLGADGHGWYATCINCNAKAPSGYATPTEALGAWNYGYAHTERKLILHPLKRSHDMFANNTSHSH